MRDAAAKDTTEISAPVPKSDAADAEKTTKYSPGTAQYSKENRNHPDPSKRTHTQTTGHTKTSQTKPTQILIQSSQTQLRTHLTELHRNPRLEQN